MKVAVSTVDTIRREYTVEVETDDMAEAERVIEDMVLDGTLSAEADLIDEYWEGEEVEEMEEEWEE